MSQRFLLLVVESFILERNSSLQLQEVCSETKMWC